MLIRPSHSLLQGLGSSVAPPGPVRLAPAARAPSADLPPRSATAPLASHAIGDAQLTSAATGEKPTATPRDRHSQRGSRLDIVL